MKSLIEEINPYKCISFRYFIISELMEAQRKDRISKDDHVFISQLILLNDNYETLTFANELLKSLLAI